MIPMCATHGLARACHVCIDYCFEMLINIMTVPKRGLLGGRALLQAQLFQSRHFESTFGHFAGSNFVLQISGCRGNISLELNLLHGL